jgi:tRNA U34 5-carboxymethylaminomethyl modifying GTPase MnmE/TrmE
VLEISLLLKKTSSKMNRNICALATPAGQGAIAVIRLSGEDTPQIVGKIFTAAGGRSPYPTRCSLVPLKTVTD